jgi:hypothetical protein
VVTPDKFVIDKETLTLIDKNVSAKDKLIEFTDQGVATVDVPEDQ